MIPVKTDELHKNFVTIRNTEFSSTDETVRAVASINKISFTLLQNVFSLLPINDTILKI
jgi:hemerythrin